MMASAACPKCHGKGYVEYRPFSQHPPHRAECKECAGARKREAQAAQLHMECRNGRAVDAAGRDVGPCLYCEGTGCDLPEPTPAGETQIPPEIEHGEPFLKTHWNPSAARHGRTLKTLGGASAAVMQAMQDIGWKGRTEPFVLLYVRPGNLPSVKVTVELHKPEAPTTRVVIESDDG